MDNRREGERIRLTNSTARTLRKNARRDQKLIHTVIGVISVVMVFVSIYAGVQKNLLLVPILVLGTVALDAALWTYARRHYLDLTSQAICTEAAARAIQGERAEMERREAARRELETIKADLGVRGEAISRDNPPQFDAEKMPPAQAIESPDEPDDDGHDGQPRRRRRQAAFQVIQGEHAN